MKNSFNNPSTIVDIESNTSDDFDSVSRNISRSDLAIEKIEPSMDRTFFTIFTPIYNRKHLLHRVWESLLAQTNQNFEWIVIDNGSSDGIETLLEEYQEKAKFPMKVIYLKDSGKYLAFNKVVHIAKGELLFPADSDDTFEPNLIERMSETWLKYKADDVSGITALCKDEEGNIVGDKFPTDEGIYTYKDILYKHKIKGEKWGCIRVDILKKYPFPTNFDVTYFPDAFVWDQIGFNYKTVFINDVLRTYFQDAGDQITKQKYVTKEQMRMKNFFTLFKINYTFPKIEKYLPLNEYLAMFVFLWVTTFRSGISVSEVFSKLESRKSKTVAILTFIPAYFANIFKFKLHRTK